MTERRDLKRRVRERQARTGESYMTALRHVQAQAPDPEPPPPPPTPGPTAIPTVELLDVTEIGLPLGMKCRLAMFPDVVERADTTALLVRLRDALLATDGDRELALMRAVVLRGERPRFPLTYAPLEDSRRLMERAKAGLGGVSESGRMLVLAVEGRRGLEMLRFVLWLTPQVAAVVRPPVLLIATLEGGILHPMFEWQDLEVP